MNLDMYSQGAPDPQAEAPVTKCDQCGREIYPDEDVYFIDGRILCTEFDSCLLEYIDPELITVEEALEKI